MHETPRPFLLCKMMIESSEPEDRSIVLHGKRLPMSEPDFEKVMGLPNSGHEIDCNIKAFDEACRWLKDMLKNERQN
ncbi:hypothetical protein ACOSP7_023560 [Xanthoceras sorbifolium]